MDKSVVMKTTIVVVETTNDSNYFDKKKSV